MLCCHFGAWRVCRFAVGLISKKKKGAYILNIFTSIVLGVLAFLAFKGVRAYIQEFKDLRQVSKTEIKEFNENDGEE